jgi:hypothetical protein
MRVAVLGTGVIDAIGAGMAGTLPIGHGGRERT